MMDKQIMAMRKLGMTDEEIQEVLKADKAIDKGEKLFNLSPEQEKASKEARTTGTRKTDAYGKTTERKRKEDTVKAELINRLFAAILPICETSQVENAEREFSFTYKGRKFKVVLSAPRK